MATLLKTDGTQQELTPANGKKFKLEEIQKAVGGYIEIVAMRPGNGRKRLYVNEEGKLHGLPLNLAATALMSEHHTPGDVIVGDAVITNPGEF